MRLTFDCHFFFFLYLLFLELWVTIFGTHCLLLGRFRSGSFLVLLYRILIYSFFFFQLIFWFFPFFLIFISIFKIFVDTFYKHMLNHFKITVQHFQIHAEHWSKAHFKITMFKYVFIYMVNIFNTY